MEQVRAAIERDDFRSPDVKKLHVGPYYRAKLDDASRLLLQFVQWRGERACLALEVIRHHDYARSRFLRGAPVDEAKLVEGVEPARVDTVPVRYLHPTRATFQLLDKPLSFDDAQEDVLRRRPPLVLVGSAGSGKTALMLQKLRREGGRVAYVTESAWLAQTARGLYVAHDYDPGEQEADFLSYSQLLESVEVPRGRPVTFRDFRGFFERHRARLKFTDAHACFEELRGVLTSDPAGLLSQEAYLGLGVRQSIFTPEQRAELYALVPTWQRWMEDAGLYEPNLVAHAWLPRVEPRYDFVAVDEVQDLTPVQLTLALRTLKAAGHFIVGGDANQVVHPNFFSWAKVKTLFWRGVGLDEARDVAVLDVSYRNSEAVTAAANAVLKVKHARFGSVDRESTYLMRAVQGVPGEARGVRAGTKAVAELDTRTRGSARVAVVVLREEHKAEARAHFHTPLVFSVQEAKGLEYETVILYRLLSSERRTFAELAEGVSREDLQRETLEYRRAKDKGDRSLEAYKFYVNALYVALTRAVHAVWMVEDDPDHPLLAHLPVRFGESAGDVAVARSSAEEWQREAHRLEQQGKLEQAEAIRTAVLHTQPVPWTVLDGPGVRALAEKALDPRGVSSKARQQLLDYACFHDVAPLAQRLAEEVRFAQAQGFVQARPAVVRRLLQPYEARNFKDLLWQTEKHGVDFRTPMGLTPLMMAAYAGNQALVEALLERGAEVEARDHLGHQALHWALRRAWEVPDFTRGAVGAVYDLLAPPSFDVQVEGRLVQVGREMGEYFLFQALLADFGRLYRTRSGRPQGWTAAHLTRAPFSHFPDVVVREPRRKRTYINHVLSRSEVGSSYSASRRLWRRERQGHYVPNPALLLRVRAPDGTPTWQPVLEVLGLPWLESHLRRGAVGRLTGGAPAGRPAEASPAAGGDV